MTPSLPIEELPPHIGRVLAGLVAFMPVGKMEAFFRTVTAANAMPPLAPALWQAHDMTLPSPPLANG
jgi:hypothetical protein